MTNNNNNMTCDSWDYRFGILAADKMSRPSIRPFVASPHTHAHLAQTET